MLSAPAIKEGSDNTKGKEVARVVPRSRAEGVLRDTSLNTTTDPGSEHKSMGGSSITKPAVASASASTSGTNKGKAPAHGLGTSTVAISPLSARNHRLVPPARVGQKPFKPPLLAQPTRSSPRRTPNAKGNIIPPSPLRTPLPVPIPTTSTRSRMNIHMDMDMVAETPCRGTIRKHNANVDIGENDPEGDESFDSFDGMFQEGGPEVEELFRAIDAR